METEKKTNSTSEAEQGSQASGDSARDSYRQMFKKIFANEANWFDMLDSLSTHIEVFAPDGTSIFINKALMEFNGIPDRDVIVGTYNLIDDPVCNDQLEMREGIQRAFSGGEAVWLERAAPIQDLIDRGIIIAKPYEAAYMDINLRPVMRNGKVAFVVCEFILRNVYYGDPHVAKAKEYIERNWLEEYNAGAVAKAASMSISKLYRLFKQQVGMPPGDYHRNIRIECVKEKLADMSLTVFEVFDVCGVNNRSGFTRTFKAMTGTTPTEYRESMK